MQIRLDNDIARIVKRESETYRRKFKRTKSASAIVNLKLRDAMMGQMVRRLFWNKRLRIFLWKCDIMPVSIKELETIWGAACQRCQDNYDSGNKLEEQFQQGIAIVSRQLLNDHMPQASVKHVA